MILILRYVSTIEYTIRDEAMIDKMEYDDIFNTVRTYEDVNLPLVVHTKKLT